MGEYGQFEKCSNFTRKTGKISPFNDVHHHKFIVDTGAMVTVKNQLKCKYQKKFQVRLSGKWVRMESSNSVQTLRSK